MKVKFRNCFGEKAYIFDGSKGVFLVRVKGWAEYYPTRLFPDFDTAKTALNQSGEWKEVRTWV